jgi:N-acylneuraminate cytidylyltransferase
MSKILAVIPARAGSKSLPNKNIKLLNDKPLLAYSIKYATDCKLISKTIVSTDSSKYAQVAKNYGASVPFLRPEKFAKDVSQDYDFMRHALDFYHQSGVFYDILILLRPTSPLRPEGLIERGLELLENNPQATSIRSVTQVKEHPWRTWKENSDGSITGLVNEQTEPYNLPRQQLPNIYFQTGDIELVRASTLLAGSVTGNNVYPLIINHEQMIDIDTPDDFKLATKKIL